MVKLSKTAVMKDVPGCVMKKGIVLVNLSLQIAPVPIFNGSHFGYDLVIVGPSGKIVIVEQIVCDLDPGSFLAELFRKLVIHSAQL